MTSIKVRNNDKPKYLKLHRKLYKIYGISFDEKESATYFFYSRIVLFFILFVYPVIQFFASIYYIGDWNRTSTLLTFTLIDLVGNLEELENMC